MAQETKRGCGYRVVGGLYLCGEFKEVYCDRLPYRLDICPVCSHGIKPTRSYVKVNPERLFGAHFVTARYARVRGDEKTEVRTLCGDAAGCFLCEPREDPAFIMTVGDKFYSPESFLDEAKRLGISKRLPAIPKELKLGQTVIYLAHSRACPVETIEALPLSNGHDIMETNRVEFAYGIFTAFIPQRVEKLIWRHEATEDELKRLEKRGITPVIIDDGDMDHLPPPPAWINRARKLMSEDKAAA